ncbi:MAG: prephenate dehydratase [Pseudobdellovibrionaceae bacterium]
MKVGIQGFKASFHDIVARNFFKSSEVLEIAECATFLQLASDLHNKKLDYAVMAIENTIAGSILPNYTLLEQHQIKIIGEYYLRISMNLMALPGEKIEDLKVVQSHPMALHQCTEFLAQYPFIRIQESIDTAESAKQIALQNLKGQSAIASSLAAEEYKLNILAAGIETNKQNYTRFLILAPKDNTEYTKQLGATQLNKATLRFEVTDRPGCLVEVLQIFGEFSLNMTKIQSVPLLGRPYEYSFHVDVEWDHADDTSFNQALESLQKRVRNVVNFGCYQKGQKPVL